MNGLWGGLRILANKDEILRGLRSGVTRGFDYEQLMFLLLGAVALVALLVLARRYFGNEGGTVRKRPDYFKQAVNVVGLGPREYQDLLRLAGRARLHNPMAVLLSPDGFREAVRRAFAEDADAELHARLEVLCERLYGQPLADDDAGTATSR